MLTSCASYRPHPLDPPALERAIRARSLDDPGLRAFVADHSQRTVAEWPLKTLDLETATLAAWYFSPSLAVARAGVQTAQAGVLAAGGRVNPSLSVSSGYNTAPGEAGLLDFLPGFTIETAGKRGKRVLVASQQLEAARLRVEEAAWSVRDSVRSALADLTDASRRRALFEQEVEIRSEAARMLALRLEVGEIAKPLADVADQELAAARASLADAAGREAGARAAFAAALALPLDALSGVPIAEPSLDSAPPAEQLPLGQIQRAGLLHRADIRRALAEYAAAEAAVRLEVARQYPNVELNPGVVFEEGFLRYTFGFTLAPPLLNRNQGPLAVAEARRAESEERFKQLQTSAMGEMEQALATYEGARNELAAAGQRLAAARRIEAAAEKTFAAGETDRLALAAERLLRIAAEQGHLGALRRAQQALSALEDAIQQPLAGGPPAFRPEPPGNDRPTS